MGKMVWSLRYGVEGLGPCGMGKTVCVLEEGKTVWLLEHGPLV